MLQEICKRGVSWDDAIPENVCPKWEAWKANLIELQNITIPRCLLPQNMTKQVSAVELHHFCDASNSGYGSCSYLRVVDENQAHCTLVASKARVSPTKGMTIPRLELTAAVVAAKMGQKVK